MPVAGGAFSYIRVTFGEFAAILTGANLIIDYVLSNAAVARSLTTYLGTAIGISSAEIKWRLTISALPKGFNQIDFISVVIVLILTLIICYSTRESSVLNIVFTALHIAFEPRGFVGIDNEGHNGEDGAAGSTRSITKAWKRSPSKVMEKQHDHRKSVTNSGTDDKLNGIIQDQEVAMNHHHNIGFAPPQEAGCSTAATIYFDDNNNIAAKSVAADDKAANNGGGVKEWPRVLTPRDKYEE